jgi:hypothetical protein
MFSRHALRADQNNVIPGDLRPEAISGGNRPVRIAVRSHENAQAIDAANFNGGVNHRYIIPIFAIPTD